MASSAARPAAVAGALIALVLGASAVAPAQAHGPAQGSAQGSAQARPDSYRVKAGRDLVVRGDGVLGNDRGDLTTVVAHTAPGHGTLALQPDGSFRYTPEAGFTGTDTFTYTTSDAVDLYRTSLPPLGVAGGATITGGAFGSAWTPAPGERDTYYGLTDRGPNVDGPNGSKVEPLPDFTPAIGKFRLRDGKAVLERRIPLRAGDGSPYNGQVNCTATTGETITGLDGVALPCSEHGYDPEGLVALRDGTFWVSDEYGPLITRFDARGRALQRLSPFDGTLPTELRHRLPNRGMEGLAVTPDGRTLVGIMQSALQATDSTAKPASVAPIRIVTVDLRSGKTHEYLYLLDDPAVNGTAASEITALSATRFVVDERDGRLAPGAYKKVYEIDLRGATDVGPANLTIGTAGTAGTYDTERGLLVGGTSIEKAVGTASSADAAAVLAAAGITPVTKTLSVDFGALVTGLDASGGFFGHDKVEGIAAVDGGRTLVISNDSDFGINGLANAVAPFQVKEKLLPNGQQDDGELLAVHLDRLPATTTTATVTVTVTGPVIKN